MKTTISKLILMIVALIIYSCSSVKNGQVNHKQLDTLTSLMIGHFNSSTQAKSDTNFFDITLHMTPIWKNLDKNVRWLYVEQAVTKKQEKPYRQRVYKVQQIGENKFSSEVYTLKNQKDVIQPHLDMKKLSKISMDSLVIRNGCAVYLEETKKGVFSGSTKGSECGSDLRGAAYATSKVTIDSRGIQSWDQGFNLEGKQVWGAMTGGYDFVKIKD
jgi:CpeT protein